MGTKGIQIVEMDCADLIADLNRAYADEWLYAARPELMPRSHKDVSN